MIWWRCTVFFLTLLSGTALSNSRAALPADDVRQSPTAPQPATLVIRLPAEAELFVQNQKIGGSGAERRFKSPALSPDKKYSYSVRIVWNDVGRQQSAEQRVSVRAGEVVQIEFATAPSRPTTEPPPAKEPPSEPSPPSDDEVGDLTADEQAVLELTNKERVKAGAKPLAANGQLTAAARGHSANMAKQKKLDHMLDGKQFFQRIEAAGYRGGAAGENIAYGARTAAEVLSMWMNSPGHKANILNSGFVEIGIGIVVGQDGTKYYTQVFATPLDPVRQRRP